MSKNLQSGHVIVAAFSLVFSKVDNGFSLLFCISYSIKCAAFVLSQIANTKTAMIYQTSVSLEHTTFCVFIRNVNDIICFFTDFFITVYIVLLPIPSLRSARQRKNQFNKWVSLSDSQYCFFRKSIKSQSPTRHENVVSEKTYAEKIASSGIPQKGDLLVTGVGTIGLPYLIDTDDRIYFKDGNILWIKKNEDFFYPKWLYLLFLDKHIKQQITDNSGFTTVGTFTIKNAKKLSVPMPPVPEQKAIASALSTFDTYIDSLTELIEKKRNIRDGALEDLVSGKLNLSGYRNEWIRTTLKRVANGGVGTTGTALLPMPTF